MRRDREFIRIKETSLTQSKLAITERAIERFRSGDRFAGITMGKEYESLYRGKVVEWHRSWLSHHPNPQDNKFAIAMHGSSVRGEMVFNSDLDLAVCVENEGPGEEVKTSLGKFFQEAGVLADIHIWHPGVARRDGNPTFSQEINTGRYVCGDQDTFQQIASNAYFDRAAKAGHTIFETLKPPPYAKTTEAGVFNMKYDPIGSCSNLLVLRTLGNVYGGDGGSTLDQLQLLAQNGIFNDAEVEALHLAYSEYLFFRNLMHIFGDGLAERMGPRTRN